MLGRVSARGGALKNLWAGDVAMEGKNIAVIFAGGTGQRMKNQACPKQFLKLHGKPVLAFTLECFERHEQIDAIILASLPDWIGYCWELAETYHIEKLAAVVPGGRTSQASIHNGLEKARDLYGEDAVALIHDGVRPFIDVETITKCIQCVHKNGSAITVSPAVETIMTENSCGRVGQILDRSHCQLVRAPQCFYIRDILRAHERTRGDGGLEFIDSPLR